MFFLIWRRTVKQRRRNFRVEDTLNRMGYACGATHMNVFVITSSIVITMEFPEMAHGADTTHS